MGIYDLVMLIIFLGAVLFGAWKGLAWQIASLAAVVVSYFVAMNFREPVAQYISAEPPWNKFGAMLILFLGTSLGIWLIFGRIKETIKKMHLGGFDRQAGALLGAVKGALLCMVVTMFAVTLFGEATTTAVCNSRSGGYITRGIDQLTTVVPDEIHDILHPHVERFRQALEENKGLNPQTQYVQGGDSEAGPGNWNGNGAQPIYGGKQNSNTAQNGQPQFGTFNPYQQSNNQQNYQNYEGQWQVPAGQQGGGTATYRQAGFGGNINLQNNGYQPPQHQPQNGQSGQTPLITRDQNGLPNVNLQINAKELIDAGIDAGAEAVKDGFNRWRESLNKGSNQ